MTAFNVPVDIANRALQHVGASRIMTPDFSEISKNCKEVAFVYDKLRQSELQRNTWRFAVRTTVLRPIGPNTMLLTPSLWSSQTTYFVGSIIVDPSGNIWQSNSANNLGQEPIQTPTWDLYCGPMTASLWDSTTSYRVGELVYTTPGDGTNRVYMSMLDGNTDNPATATAWDATVTYSKNQVITRSSVAYMSRIDLNLNQDPATTFFAEWASGTTYASGAKVTATDGLIYQSSTNGNVGNNPTTDGGSHWTNTGVLSPWDTTFVSGAGSLNWRQIGGIEFPYGVTLTPMNIIWPVGTGPANQASSRNAYRLPANFLRLAPLDSKAAATSPLGFPGNTYADDWEFRGAYLTTRTNTEIIFAFVADTVDVATFDGMFCEGLGARIGFEVCETLTQSTEKKQGIGSEYQKFMSEARQSNAIIMGPDDQPLDDWIACRL